MGFLRGVGIVILSIVFFLVVFAGNSFLMLGLSLNYDNVLDVASESFEEIAPEGVFDSFEENLGDMEKFCEAHDDLTYEDDSLGNVNVPCEIVLESPEEIINYLEKDYPELQQSEVREKVLSNLTENYDLATSYCSEGGEIPIQTDEFDFDLVISCDAILGGNSEEVRAEFFESAIKGIYYNDYDCESPFKCEQLGDVPFHLVSDEARSYWMGKFWLMFVIAFVIFGLLFLIVGKKSSAFFIVGAILSITALPFLAIESILKSFIEDSLISLVEVFVGKSSFVFSLSFFIGLAGIGIGVGMKAFGVGFNLSKKLSDDNK